MKKSLAVICFLTMCATVPAFAADKMGGMDMDHMKMMCDKHFKMMDTNDDGKVSKDEFMAAMQKKFDEMDTKHAGVVTKDEMMDAHMKEMKDMGMMKDGSMDSK